MTKEEIINGYEEIGKIIKITILNGDYKTGNKQAKKKQRLYKEIEKDKDLAKEVLSVLLKSENVVTRTLAAVNCLKMNIMVKEAKRMLHSIAINKEYGIFSFDAEMCLKKYKEGGIL